MSAVSQHWITAAHNYERQARIHWLNADTPGNKFARVDERVARQFDEKADECYAAAAADRQKRPLVLEP